MKMKDRWDEREKIIELMSHAPILKFFRPLMTGDTRAQHYEQGQD